MYVHFILSLARNKTSDIEKGKQTWVVFLFAFLFFFFFLEKQEKL